MHTSQQLWYKGSQCLRVPANDLNLSCLLASLEVVADSRPNLQAGKYRLRRFLEEGKLEKEGEEVDEGETWVVDQPSEGQQ